MVLFDLPVGDRTERADATKFRNFLLDEGFERAQFSVYLRFTSGKEAAAALMRKIEFALPPRGKVDILQFTDKQYENIVSFHGRTKGPQNQNPRQLVLF